MKRKDQQLDRIMETVRTGRAPMNHTRKEPCGCKTGLFPEPIECVVCHQINPVDHYTLTYCPLHAAAPELLAACVYALNELKHPHPNPENAKLTIQELEQAIRHAEGR